MPFDPDIFLGDDQALFEGRKETPDTFIGGNEYTPDPKELISH